MKLDFAPFAVKKGFNRKGRKEERKEKTTNLPLCRVYAQLPGISALESFRCFIGD